MERVKSWSLKKHKKESMHIHTSIILPYTTCLQFSCVVRMGSIRKTSPIKSIKLWSLEVQKSNTTCISAAKFIWSTWLVAFFLRIDPDPGPRWWIVCTSLWCVPDQPNFCLGRGYSPIEHRLPSLCFFPGAQQWTIKCFDTAPYTIHFDD